MNLESTMETVAAIIPDHVKDTFSEAVSLIPGDLDLITTLKFLLLFSAASLILGFLGRVAFGKRSNLNHALSSAAGILFLYVITIVIYVWKIPFLSSLLAPLPFVSFYEDIMVIYPIPGTAFAPLCSQVLALVLLSFLVNFLDTLVPKGERIISWYFLRFLTIGIAMILHLLLNLSLQKYLPNILVAYAPVVLLIVLLISFFLGFLNLILGITFTVLDPLFGALYSFFFSNLVGKQLSKAIFTTVILCIVIALLSAFGYTVIQISPAAILSCLPMAVVMLLLWYLIGHIL